MDAARDCLLTCVHARDPSRSITRLVMLLQVVFLHPKDNDGVLMELEEVGHN
jgi:hypothetical protein